MSASPPHLPKAQTARWSAPAEVTAPPANERAYEEWREADTLRAPYNVPEAFFQGIRTDGVGAYIECPLICFCNARSGGLVGADLALKLARAIGRIQVFDISEHRPDKVLQRFYDNLKQAEQPADGRPGDPRARAVRERMRILVCGGDGTITWVMGVIKRLRLQPEPPVAIMPLGTGNDLSRTLMWGPAFTSRWITKHQAMYKTLNKVATAREEKLDCWNVTITTPRKEFIKEHPHCLAPPVPTSTAAATVAAVAAAAGGLPAPPLAHGRPSAHSVQLPSASGTTPEPREKATPAWGQLGTPIHRGHSSGLAPGGASASAPALHPAVVAARDSSIPGGDRSIAPSVVATLGSATPLHNIATSSVGSAVTTFTTATNMSLHTAAAQAGTPVPTLISGAVSTAEDDAGIGVLAGSFWNYFSVGLDAKAAWGFHSLREEQPGCTSSRAANQFWYSFYSCTSGWFCCAQPLHVKVHLEVLRPGPAGAAAGWQPVELPRTVKALVVLNLQSYAGGRNLWGPETSAAERKAGFVTPAFNDGLLEVVGLESGWHTGIVMASKGKLLHGRRLCQVAGVRLTIQAPYVRSDGEFSHCYMQIDGEPWRQDIPCTGAGGAVRVEIVHGGQSRVLVNEPVRKSGPSRIGPSVSTGTVVGGAAGQTPSVTGVTRRSFGAALVSAVQEQGPPSAPPSVSLSGVQLQPHPVSTMGSAAGGGAGGGGGSAAQHPAGAGQGGSSGGAFGSPAGARRPSAAGSASAGGEAVAAVGTAAVGASRLSQVERAGDSVVAPPSSTSDVASVAAAVAAAEAPSLPPTTGPSSPTHSMGSRGGPHPT